MTFLSKLRTTQRRQNSLLCIGLDPSRELLPRHLRSRASGVFEFNRSIIEATSDLVCAYKLNLAFYEALGANGWKNLRQTLSAIPSNVLTIGDGKRGDIGNTAEHYAQALFDELSFDAVTVNPYMGFDSLAPFLQRDEKGTFLLALTSNAGSKDFQRLVARGRPLYEHVVRKAKVWNKKKNIGLVAGATHPTELKRIRTIAPDLPILIPGIGKQGGDLRSAIRYGCDRNGELALINASRSIIFASGRKDFAEAARREAIKLSNEISYHRKRFLP